MSATKGVVVVVVVALPSGKKDPFYKADGVGGRVAPPFPHNFQSNNESKSTKLFCCEKNITETPNAGNCVLNFPGMHAPKTLASLATLAKLFHYAPSPRPKSIPLKEPTW